MDTSRPLAVASGKMAAATRTIPHFRSGFLAFAGASLVFALAAAIECHSVVTASSPGAPLLPSALYGLALWLWWGLAASALWAIAENGYADFFSLPSVLLQIVIAPALSLAHL